MKNKLDKFVFGFSIFVTIDYIIGVILAFYYAPWWPALKISLALLPSVLILFALNSVINRVVDLEREALANNPDFEKKEEEDVEDVELCSKCGYQLFDDDKICPNCKTKRKE